MAVAPKKGLTWVQVWHITITVLGALAWIAQASNVAPSLPLPAAQVAVFQGVIALLIHQFQPASK